MGIRKIVSLKSADNMTRSSWIRKMFEEGRRRKLAVGAQNVFDYTLGNPNFDPPARVQERLISLANQPVRGRHGYMSNAGFEDVRTAIADHVTQQQSLVKPITLDNIVMTVGAAGGLNVIFKSILDPGDEVIVPSPYFVEYGFYIDNHGGKMVLVDTDESFQLDPAKIGEAITLRTKAILLNSPNNPTGAIYSRQVLEDLSAVVKDASQKFGQEILVVADEPYAKLVFDDEQVPPMLQIFPNGVITTSFSKDLSLAGERIGYIAFNPSIESAADLFAAMVFNNRILGFINAPALAQQLVVGMLNEVVGLEEYVQRRNILYNALVAMGYDVVKPQGTFYMFPKSPIPDDVKFCNEALTHNLLIVPGYGFGRSGHFRMSFSSIEQDQIARSLAVFEALARQYGL